MSLSAVGSVLGLDFQTMALKHIFHKSYSGKILKFSKMSCPHCSFAFEMKKPVLPSENCKGNLVPWVSGCCVCPAQRVMVFVAGGG